MYGVSIGDVIIIYFHYTLYVAPWKFKLASCRSNYEKSCGGEDVCLFMLRLSWSPWVSQTGFILGGGRKDSLHDFQNLVLIAAIVATFVYAIV